jgi:solute carrier family 25 oxoglutarate transporter 11
MSQAKPAPKKMPTWVTFAQSGLGGVTGWLFVHPLDVVKVRLQLQVRGGVCFILFIQGEGAKTSTMGVVRNVLAQEGAAALYAGLSAAVMRQAVYTTARLAFYDIIRDALVFPGLLC